MVNVLADNYKDTIYRMHDSSCILYDNEKWFNANYLAGYVLECYCKLVLDFAMKEGTHLTKSTIRGYSHNVQAMRDEIDLLMQSGTAVTKYCIDLNQKCSHIIANWHPEKRYEADTHVLGSSDLSDEINKEIKFLIDIILKMDIDGVI